ncbi:MAG TPA: carboxypeptidase-like regulatory domain-containing protein, partial [Vicinamibacterales bacterium]|nr:carboxypeptidase-like regulatory domain-containing protein [Vicinamibacterales bacterium]
MTRLRPIVLLVAVLFTSAVSARAQTPVRDAKLILTVTDQTAGVLPGATVTVTGLGAVKLDAPLVVHTIDKGIATIENLVAGKYAVRIDMDGFDPTLIPDLTVSNGENKRTVTLTLKSVSETVTV